MKFGRLTLCFLALACAGGLESACLADSHGKFPGKGSEAAYNRSVGPMNEGAKKYLEHDFESSILLTTQAIAIYPYDSATHQNLGNALRRAGRIEESIPELKKAIELEPDYLSAWLGLGAAYEAQKKLADAERCYRRGVELKPDSFGALFDLGDVLRQEGKLDDAKQWFLRAKNSPKGKDNQIEIDKAIGLCDKRIHPASKEASN